MAKTRKIKRAKVLKVDADHKIKEMEKLLAKGSITIVLIYAEWCGACHRFMKNIWNPSCSTSAKHQRIAVREDMVKNTSLANANFKYLPSLIVVDEKGQMQNFKTPEGNTNAMPTPKNKGELNRIVNVPVLPANADANAAEAQANALVVNTKAANTLGVMNTKAANTLGVMNAKAANTLLVNNTRKTKNALINNTQLSNTLVNNTRVNNTLSTNVLTTKISQNKRNNVIPDGKVYMPTPQVAPADADADAKQKGGASALPAAILGSLSMLLRRKTRRSKGKRQ